MKINKEDIIFGEEERTRREQKKQFKEKGFRLMSMPDFYDALKNGDESVREAIKDFLDPSKKGVFLDTKVNCRSIRVINPFSFEEDSKHKWGGSYLLNGLARFSREKGLGDNLRGEDLEITKKGLESGGEVIIPKKSRLYEHIENIFLIYYDQYPRSHGILHAWRSGAYEPDIIFHPTLAASVSLEISHGQNLPEILEEYWPGLINGIKVAKVLKGETTSKLIRSLLSTSDDEETISKTFCQGLGIESGISVGLPTAIKYLNELGEEDKFIDRWKPSNEYIVRFIDYSYFYISDKSPRGRTIGVKLERGK